MMPHSLRWRLQLWYGLVLLVVLFGFGYAAFQLERSRLARQFDTNLGSLSQQVAEAMGRNGPRFGGPPNRRGGRRLGGQQFDDEPGNPEGPPAGAAGRRPLFEVPDSLREQFDDGTEDSNYYVIWGRVGRELTRSSNAPPNLATRPDFAEKESLPDFFRRNGSNREVVKILPPGDTILIGRSLEPQNKELEAFALKLMASGFGVLLLGIVGGGWLVGRAIRPIGDISRAADQIAEGDLSRRIDASDAHSELGQLIGVLNRTFGRLDDAFARQRQFTADAAHELRTPVTVMLTRAQTALMRERDPAQYRETIEACQRAANRMRRLIESLLALSKIDADPGIADGAPVDLAETVREAVDQLAPVAEEKRSKLELELRPARCLGDSVRLGQVATNLVANAIQHSPPESRVRVATGTENGRAFLEVTDTGPGIAADDLPHVFDRFYRADKSRTGSKSGAGLGLAICKAIADGHGASLTAKSVPGQGATFRFELPGAAE